MVAHSWLELILILILLLNSMGLLKISGMLISHGQFQSHLQMCQHNYGSRPLQPQITIRSSAKISRWDSNIVELLDN